MGIAEAAIGMSAHVGFADEVSAIDEATWRAAEASKLARAALLG